MTADEFTTLLAFAIAMSFSPGPNTTLATALAANVGLRRSLRFVVAVPTGWILLMLACSLGLGALVLALPAARWGVKVVGVAYLLWLAWKLARTDRLGEADARRLQVGFWQGVALQFVNIKAWMLALTLAAGWVASANGVPASNPGERLAIACGVMVLCAFFSNLAYASIGSVLRHWLAQGARLLWFNRAMALVLVVVAVWMAFA